MSLGFNKVEADKPLKFGARDVGKRPIDLLAPGTPRHAVVKKYLLDRLGAAERGMSKRYDRWRLNELQFQAYINLQDHERLLKQAQQQKSMPEITSLVIPYSYSTIMSIVTYLLQTFAGRDQIFQVQPGTSSSIEAVPFMEAALLNNCNHERFVLKLFQWLLDSQVYNLGVMRNLWTVEERMTTVYRPGNVMGPMGAMPDFGGPRQKSRERKVVYEGSKITNIDPFMFFPDPRVTFVDASRKAEFVFWRDYEGRHVLEDFQAQGLIAHLDSIGERQKPTGMEGGIPQSNRNNGSANSTNSSWRSTQEGLEDFVQLDQCSIVIVPSKLGLGEGTRPEKWLFTIANKNQIIQAEPLQLDHDLHPISVTEPYSMGYTPGGMSMVEMLEPIQSGMSWLLNSHIHNVRSIINNSFVVDPNAIDMSTFKDGRPGRLIKLKPSAIGRDVRQVVNQLQVYDATQQHIGDIEAMRRIGDMLSAVNDNMRGQQQTGGRKTATEVRTAGENGASRLAMLSRVISAQGLVDQGLQLSVNLQQNMSETFMAQTLGPDGLQKMMSISPESIVGEFNFPVHDGTLPIDRIALVEVWKEILMGVAQSPILGAEYSLSAIFEFVAQLSGAKNIDKFKLQPQTAAMQGMNPDQLQQQVTAGNVLPFNPAGQQSLPGGSGIPRFA